MMTRFIAAAIPLLIAGAAHASQAAVEPATASVPAAQTSAPATPAASQSDVMAPVSHDQDVMLDALLSPPSKATTGVPDLRTQVLTDAGKTVGFRGGMAARARVLREALNARSDGLDTIFQFSPLLNKNGTIPPVIVEARELSSFSTDQIRMANRVYKIEKEERFVSVPPTWRDYLLTGLPASGVVDLPSFDARPQDGKETAIWRDAVQKGWVEGEKQADAILEANFNRLTRDYTGMLLYSTLLQQGMISTTRVAESHQTVTGNGKQLMLDDTLRRVTSRAAFETDANKWRPTVNRGKAPAPKRADPTSTTTSPAPVDGTPSVGGAK